ncbi:hypothetical protein E3N88_12495 [Mikania micrantha]|uniref:Reverse transcriptase domain-containing protein n=1 Tax=Mikania micrantha TaxID=192012 RepID=A0A5N6P8N6_9ASTR|nr:hypothetical protein E3N88_12495 [Mikania micrantha]
MKSTWISNDCNYRDNKQKDSWDCVKASFSFIYHVQCEQSDHFDYHSRYRAPETFRPSGKPDPTPPARGVTLTDSEKQTRFLKGECFRCGDKYGPGHRCKTGSLKVLESTEGTDETVPVVIEDSEAEEDDLAKISLHAIFGKSHMTTMKLNGLLGTTEVLILIDSGSTHNFISKTLVSSLTITQDFYPFSIGGVDVVLGIQWLSSLNTVQANWNDMFLIFSIDGKQYKLQGVTSGPQKSAYFQHLAVDTEVSVQVPEPIKPLISKFQAVFLKPNELPPFCFLTHDINLLPNSTPPNIRPYQYPYTKKSEIESQVDQLLQSGFIQPSNSPFSSPVLLVKKKDNSCRMCVDYRALNKITIPDKYPIPNIDELLDELYGAAIFSKLDLRSGYYQIRVNPKDVEKTAFKTHSGHYEFKVMPFGLTNAPSTFQSVMNDLFRPFLRRFILVFFDDILVYSPSMETHVYHLSQALDLLHSNRFFVKLSKCCFGQTQVSFLGHLLTADGVHVENEKIASIQSWPIPKSVKEVRGFLELTGYYRRFVRNYGTLARPLKDLTKKDAFLWNDTALAAFQALKDALMSTPIIKLPDFSKPFIVECDASSDGIGAILSQEEHPIAYFSKGFSSAHKFKSAYDRELLALVLAVQKWSHYLLGHHFFIRTDHYTLKFLLEQRLTTTEQQRLLIKLMPFDFTIIHRAGKENRGADALSRRPHSGELLSL